MNPRRGTPKVPDRPRQELEFIPLLRFVAQQVPKQREPASANRGSGPNPARPHTPEAAKGHRTHRVIPKPADGLLAEPDLQNLDALVRSLAGQEDAPKARSVQSRALCEVTPFPEANGLQHR